jgi:hypothetical protein
MVTTRQTKKNLKPLPAGKHGKSKKASTLRRHRCNEGKSAHEAERIRALNALRSLRSKKRLAAAKKKEVKDMDEEERGRWIDDYVEKETRVARQRVEAADAAVKADMEKVYDPKTVDEPKKTFQELLALVGDDIDNVVPSDDDDDWDDSEEDSDEEAEEDDDARSASGDIHDFVPGQMDKTTMAEIAAARARIGRMFELTKEGYAEAEAFWRKRDQEVGVDTLKHSLLPFPSSEHDCDNDIPPDSDNDVPPASSKDHTRRKAKGSKRKLCTPPADPKEKPVGKRAKLVCSLPMWLGTVLIVGKQELKKKK